MTFWIILGGLGVLLWVAALVLVIALCVTADELPTDDEPRDDEAPRVPLYSTADRGADPRVVRLMHTGMHADDAVRRAMRETR